MCWPAIVPAPGRHRAPRRLIIPCAKCSRSRRVPQDAWRRGRRRFPFSVSCPRVKSSRLTLTLRYAPWRRRWRWLALMVAWKPRSRGKVSSRGLPRQLARFSRRRWGRPRVRFPLSVPISDVSAVSDVPLAVPFAGIPRVNAVIAADGARFFPRRPRGRRGPVPRH